MTRAPASQIRSTSPESTIGRLLACHYRQPADQHHEPGNDQADLHEVINALETDDHLRVVVFDSTVDDYFLNHSDFTANFDDVHRTTGRSDRLAAVARFSSCV